MKKILLGLAMAALLPLGAQAQMKYAEGQDFVTLPAQLIPLEQPTITEFFWFGCVHCYNIFEPLDTWSKEKMPDNIALVKVPAIPSPNWQVGGQLFYTAEALGVDMHKFEADVFNEFHKKGNRGVVVDPKRAQDFLTTYAGAEADAVAKAWNSFAVKQKMENARQLFNNAGLDATPSFLVNGRYVVGVQRNYERTFDILQTVALSKPYKEEGAAKASEQAEEAKAEEAKTEEVKTEETKTEEVKAEEAPKS